jgi:EAL domain-containing protein (putative c-di-GMP-specific phosphodiesterase class I)
VAVEALLRWQHNGKFVSPAEFIPLAEKSGSIHAIGSWVLRQACLDARDWGVALSVNVSAVQFIAADLAEQIEQIVEETGFPWKRLELEITETALLTAEDAVLRVMKRLKDKGVSFALDDFGTGYSSLTYLRRFPFDKLKIDRTFIADVTLTVNATIVHAVTSIGRSLGLKLVAEGVENAEQHRFLAAAGAHYLQGYLFGRPAPAGATSDRLRGELAAARSA